jgi:hypothetical protein
VQGKKSSCGGSDHFYWAGQHRGEGTMGRGARPMATHQTEGAPDPDQRSAGSDSTTAGAARWQWQRSEVRLMGGSRLQYQARLNQFKQFQLKSNSLKLVSIQTRSSRT